MKKRSTKRALATSVLSTCACVTMLAGATFAWFTDSASTGVSKIQAGTLDIALLNEAEESVEGQTLNWETGETILWEPGATHNLEPVTVKNNGNLALKYKVIITGINGDAELNDAIEWTIEGADIDKEYRLVEKDDSETITISGKMKETAGNQYQGKSIEGIGITVVATQATVESDRDGNLYDEDATYPVVVATANELVDALSDGKSVTLANDIALSNEQKVVIEKGKAVTIDLNGNTLSGVNTKTDTHNAMLDAKGGELTLLNGTVKLKHEGENMGWNGAATAIDVTAGGVLNMEGVTVSVSGTDMNFAVHLNNWGEVTMNANNCVFDAPYCGVRVFNSGFDMNNVKITNSTLKGNTRAFWVHNYIGDLDSSKHSNDAIKARLNLDIYKNNNEFEISGTAKSPIRYGYENATSVYYDANGEIVK